MVNDEWKREIKDHPPELVVVYKECIAELEQEVERLRNLVRKAAPLAWATGKYNDDAYAWEKEAEQALKKEGE